MTDTIEPMPSARIDQQQFAQQLVEAARRTGSSSSARTGC
jgi:hypothetical protein